MSSFTSEAPSMQIYRLGQCCMSYNVVAHLTAENRTSICSFKKIYDINVTSENYRDRTTKGTCIYSNKALKNSKILQLKHTTLMHNGSVPHSITKIRRNSHLPNGIHHPNRNILDFFLQYYFCHISPDQSKKIG